MQTQFIPNQRHESSWCRSCRVEKCNWERKIRWEKRGMKGKMKEKRDGEGCFTWWTWPRLSDHVKPIYGYTCERFAGTTTRIMTLRGSTEAFLHVALTCHRMRDLLELVFVFETPRILVHRRHAASRNLLSLFYRETIVSTYLADEFFSRVFITDKMQILSCWEKKIIMV